MHLERDPINPQIVLATPEDSDEVTVLIDAMVPTSWLSYIRSVTTNYKAFRDLCESRVVGEMPPLRLTEKQLRWIGRRVAPWEQHTLPSASHLETMETAYKIAVEISEFLGY